MGTGHAAGYASNPDHALGTTGLPRQIIDARVLVKTGGVHALQVLVIQIILEVDSGRDHGLLKHFIVTEVASLEAADHATRHMAHVLELLLVLEAELHAGRSHS